MSRTSVPALLKNSSRTISKGRGFHSRQIPVPYLQTRGRQPSPCPDRPRSYRGETVGRYSRIHKTLRVTPAMEAGITDSAVPRLRVCQEEEKNEPRIS